MVIAAVDVDLGSARPGRRKQEKMAERSTAWVRGLQAGLKDSALEGNLPTAIWAPILPIEAEMQRTYLDHLEDEGVSELGGLVLYDDSNALDVPASLQSLPRASFSQPQSPHQVLRSISLGVDLFALPFVAKASDGGIALTFKFPSDALDQAHLPLAFDLWSPAYATDVAPLEDKCTCHTCRHHHRAYIHHLLLAKEMLAWVLLQIHNHHIVEGLFQGVRDSIAQGTFVEAVEDFSRVYESGFPESKGQGPR